MEILSKSGIYKITNPKGKVYIGRSINIRKRLREHKNKSNSLIYRSINKYGYENHTFEALVYLAEIDHELLNKLEIYFIKLYDSCNPKIGLNITSGGGRLGFKHEQSTIDKMRRNRKGKQNSLGRVLSEETKRKISMSNMGKKLPEEAREKIKKHFLENGVSFLCIDLETGIYYDSQRDMAKALNLPRSIVRKNKRFKIV